MSTADEVAALRALAHRLSETWPAERRAARWEAERDNTLDDRARMRSPHVETGGYWQHRRLIFASGFQAAANNGLKVIGSSSTPTEIKTWRGPRDRARADEQSLVHDPISATHRRCPCSWMPSIAGIGPIALRWAPTVERDDPDSQPRDVPAAVWHIGSLPRDRRKFAQWHIKPPRRCHRAILGALAARYTPRRSDGSCNRHDARRWMRRFRTVALIASDALEQSCDRLTSIETLCEVVGLEDAIRLTLRPRRIASRAQPGRSDAINEVVAAFQTRIQ